MLLTFEVGSAPLHHCTRTFAKIFCLLQTNLLGFLTIGRRSDRVRKVATQRFADGVNRKRRRRRDLPRECKGLVAQLFRRNEAIAQPSSEGLLSLHSSPCI